jgi:DNA-binding CsgD family transcriptional regulator
MFLRVIYVLGYSLLIYYLQATINYILSRPWTRERLIWILTASISYFIAGVFLLIKGLSPVWNLPLGIFFFTAFIFVLIDALHSLPLIRDQRGRVSVTLLFAGTFLFLPLLLVVRMIGSLFFPETDSEVLLFPVQTLYFLWLAVVLVQFLMNRILTSDLVPLPLSEKPASFFENKGITSREIEIILLLEKGLTYKEIGRDLFISANTVSNHVASIYKKTGQRSRVEMLNSLRGES